VLELEETFGILRCIKMIQERTLYDKSSWSDWFRGSRKLERREARFDESKRRDDVTKLEGEEVRCNKLTSSYILNVKTTCNL